MKMTTTQDLDDESKELIRNAESALPNAYAPYSRFHVAAALQLDDGTIVTGTNQENAAYPLCMCAERVALFTKASVHPLRPVVKMAVVARRAESDALVPATPCGSCRQVMTEFELRQRKAIEVVMLTQEEGWIKLPSAGMLLPFGFGQSNLVD